MKVRKSYLAIILAIIIGSMLLSGCSGNGAENSTLPDNNSGGTIDIGLLEIGDRVMDTTWEWEYRTGYGYTAQENDVTAPVVWIVVAKDHYGTGSVTLLSENLLGYFTFDTSMLESGLVAGWGHWGDSGTGNAQQGIRPWLNSTGIHAGEGFYAAFSDAFASLVLDTEVLNKEYENGAEYTTSDKVFIPSSTELGDTEHMDTYEIGSVFEYFAGKGDDARTAQVKDDTWGDRTYWLRNPNTQGYRPVGAVYDRGFITNQFADFNNTGVRAVVNVSNTTKVSAAPDEEGIYIIKY